MKLKPGLTANVNIYTLEENAVLIMPAKAMRFSPDPEIMKQLDDITVEQNESLSPAKKSVWVKTGNTISQRNVSIGTSDGINIQVLDGLEEGAEVVTGVSQHTPAMPENGANGESSPFMPKRPGQKK